VKLVYLLQWDDDPVGPLAEQHADVTFVRTKSREEAVHELKDAEIFIVGGPFYAGQVGEAVNASAPKLRWMQSSSIGADEFAREGVPDRVTFTNAAGLKGTTVGEHAFALLLAQVHAVPLMERLKATRDWGREALRSEVNSLEGLTALVVGYGSIGREIARKAKAFDMHVVAVNRTGEGGPPADEVHAVSDLDALLPEADAVQLSLPMSDETRHLLGPGQFAAMKQSAILVNVGRGATVDHAALTQALEQKRIAGAALDVFEFEPLAQDDPLWSMPNVIISPHVAGTGGPMYRLFADLVSSNLARFKAGEELVNVVKVKQAVARTR
jgi:phosphoglycerate dehydrogenase-like enzyme